ncbi:hypothetical protein C8R45DRAFT_1143709 [Mycena sanguinolenta]|nr:hypothetical protein C8R45DRAFT_1143709 [Mycena sanguinolenta]
MNTIDEICRYYGPKFRPHKNTNLHHRVFLQKSVELLTERQVEEGLERYMQLTAVMGTGGNGHCRSMVLTSREVNGKRDNREGPTPSCEVWFQLGAYLDAYDRCFQKQGNKFRRLERANLVILQNAEQWALEPLPGLARVRVAPTPSRGVKRKRPQDTEPKKKKIAKTPGVVMSVKSASTSGTEPIPDPISATTAYPAEFRLPTPPALSTSPPSCKRQRLSKASAGPNTIPQSVLRLLDIEADEDRVEDDEEEDDEGGDFIDKETDHETSTFTFVKTEAMSSFPEETPEEDVEDLCRIAARFDNVARKDNEERELRMGVQESHDCDAILTALCTPALCGFIIPPHWELRLIDFMKTLDGMGIVGTQGPSSRLVFYQTALDIDEAKGTNATRGANAARAWFSTHHVWFQGPEGISPLECLALLGICDHNYRESESDPTDKRYNYFARLKTRVLDGVYYNNLAFIDTARSGQIFVVPCVHFDLVPLAKGERLLKCLPCV